jgi:hypothetical protein
MKLSKLLFAVAALLGFVASGFAQNVETNKTHGVLGYLDPKTGIFRSLTRDLRSPEAAAATKTTGTFVLSANVTVSTPASAVTCSALSIVEDVAGTFITSATVAATRSGSTASCKITMPYEWGLDSPSTDHVILTLTVSAGSGLYDESVDFPAVTEKVPANGATTTLPTQTSDI